MNALPGSTLRPLGIGEILDRAVNLCVRHFLRLSVIYVVFIVPFSFVQYYATQNLNAVIAAFIAMSKHGNGAAEETARQISAAGGGSQPLVVLGTLFFLVLSPLPAAALIAATAGFYFGRDTSFADAYREGWSRFGNLIGVSVLFLVAGGLLYLVVVIVIGVLIFGVVFLSTAAPVLGIVAGIAAGTVSLVLLLGLAILAILAGQLAYVACVVERANFAVAFTKSISRVMNRTGFGRTLLAGLAFFAVFAGIALVAAIGQGLLLGLLHNVVLAVVYAAIVRIVSAALTTALIVVYYYDLRVREEGLDLELAAAAQALGPDAAPSA